MIERVNRELGTTTVVITHNAVIAAMADRVLDFGDGRWCASSATRKETCFGVALVTARIDRKLLRDLWHMKGQALAIALVVMCGVATYIMFLSTLGALRATQDNYYRDYRFADVFATRQARPAGAGPAHAGACPAWTSADARGGRGARSTCPTLPSRSPA